MNYRVAIWANGSEVSDGVNYVLLANLVYHSDVVNVNESLRSFAVSSLEIKPAHHAPGPIVG